MFTMSQLKNNVVRTERYI